MFIRNDQRTLTARLAHVAGVFGLGFFTRWAIGEVTWSGVWAFLIVALAAIDARRRPEHRGGGRAVETFAAYMIVYFYGVGSLWNFIGHFFMADTVAASIGWAPGSPFQLELAFYHLGFAVMGAFAIWVRGPYWLALVLAKTVFLFGAAYVHIEDVLSRGNLAPSNAGFTLLVWGDIFVPAVVLIVTASYMRARRAEAPRASPG